MPKDISERSVSSREKMVCPDCLREGVLEEYEPISQEYNTKKGKILHATTCSNPNCNSQGEIIEAERLREQYSGGFLGFSTRKTIAAAVLVILGLFVVAQAAGLGPLGTEPVTVSGTVTSSSGNVPNAVVVIGGQQVTTNANGSFTLQLKPGSYQAYALPPGQQSPYGATKTITVHVSKSGSLSAKTPSTANLFTLPKAETITLTRSTANGVFTIPLNSVHNARWTTVTLSGNTSQSITSQNTISLSRTPSTVNITGSIQSETLTLTAPISSRTVSQQFTYTKPITINFEGNLPPKQPQIQIASPPKDTHKTVSGRVSNSKTFNINLQKETELVATLSEGTGSELTTRKGTYRGTNPTIDIPQNSAPSLVKVSVSGNIQTSKETITGTLRNSEATFTINGNLPARDVVINFTGGNAVKSKIGSGSITASGESGATTKTTTLVRDSSGGEFLLNASYNVAKNEQYVSAGYMINGQKTKLDQGDSQTTVSLNSGDTVKLWVSASAEGTENNKNFPGDDSKIIDVTSYSVKPTEPEVGESSRVTATLKNTGNTEDSITVYLYRDGEAVIQQVYDVKAGETKTVTVGSLTFDEKNVHTVSVNGKSPTIVKVGGASLSYGKGSIEGTLYKKAGDGVVSVDTNNDGTPDCSTSASGGSCRIGKLDSGQHSINVEQKGVQSTGFKVTYTNRKGTKGVSIDINNDGNAETTKNGLLTSEQTLTTSMELGGGTHEINISIDEGSAVSYSIQWARTKLIQSPSILVNGDVVIDKDENLTGPVTISLGKWSPGNYTITFKSEKGAYTAKLRWRKPPQRTYPGVSIEGSTVCTSQTVTTNGGTCTVPTEYVQDGKTTVQIMDSETTPSVTLTYKARTTSNSIRIISKETTITEITNDQGTIKNGKWTYTAETNILQTGTTELNIVAQNPAGVNIQPEGTLQYTELQSGPANPKIIVTSNNGQHIKEVPKKNLSSTGKLQGTYTFAPPVKWFETGSNQIRVKTTNGVPLRITLTAKITGNTSNVTFSDQHK